VVTFETRSQGDGAHPSFIILCACCGSPDEVQALDEDDELWFCRECRETDLRDPWLDLGDASG